MAHDELGRWVKAHVIVDGRDVNGTAGTALAMESSSLVVDWIIITAETNNTGVMAVGASTVVAAVGTRRGTPLLAGESMTLKAVDLADVYYDATVTGDGITFTYLY